MLDSVTAMEDLAVRTGGRPETLPVTLRDAAMPIFRQRRIASLIFLGILSGAILTGLLLPRKYEAEMKILLNRDRQDAVVTPDLNAAAPVAAALGISEEDINSEVELLKSRDLLEQVVRACGLEPAQVTLWQRLIDRIRGTSPTPETRLAGAVETLNERLTVDPLKKSNLISVAYASRNPQLSARVLQTLAALYLEKHAAVHRPTGAFQFFDAESSRYRDELAAAEARLTSFDRDQNAVAPDAEKSLALQQLSQFEAEMHEDESSAEAAEKRAKALQAEETTIPQRQMTQSRRFGNAQLLADLESQLLSLELKRSDMLMKYAPDYPPVQALENQISDARRAVAQAQQSPIEDITTDRVPAQDWMATELAKAEADHAQFTARAASAGRIVRRYRNAAQQLDEMSTKQNDLLRNAKVAEDNYVLYLRKREEARISDELDSKRIVNVSIAEAATIPALPTLHFGWLLVGGFLVASIASLGAAYAVDQMATSFRTPDELHRYLDVRVLASIPARTVGEL